MVLAKNLKMDLRVPSWHFPLSVLVAHDGLQASQRPAGVPRVAASTALLAKKKGRGGGNNEGAQPRERKEKDDVIEVSHNIYSKHGAVGRCASSSPHPSLLIWYVHDNPTCDVVFMFIATRWRAW